MVGSPDTIPSIIVTPRGPSLAGLRFEALNLAILLLAMMKIFFILSGAQLRWEGLIGNSFCKQDLVPRAQISGKASRIEELNELENCVRDANQNIMILESDSLDSL
jgi:hypothetical protein